MIGDKLRLSIYKSIRTKIVNQYWLLKTNTNCYIDAISCSSFCYGIHLYCKEKHIFVFMIEDFPELMDYKPIFKDADDFWFDINLKGLRIRIDILNDIIERLDAKISRSNNG